MKLRIICDEGETDAEVYIFGWSSGCFAHLYVSLESPLDEERFCALLNPDSHSTVNDL